MTRFAVALLLLLGAVAGVLAWSLPTPAGAGGPVTTALTLFGLVVIGAAMVGLRRDGALHPGGGSVRLLVYAVFAACLLQVARFTPFEPGRFFLRVHASLAVGAALLMVWNHGTVRRPTIAIRIADLIAGALVILTVGAEVGLRAIAAWAPSPLFAARDLPPDERIRCFRYGPGTIVAGTPANDLGYPAPPFVRPADATSRTVVVVSDRTLGGGLPAPVGPTAIASRRLPDVAFRALALDGLSTPEYARLLETDGFELEPSAVIVVVDLGDDLVELGREEGPWRPLALWLDRENVRLYLALHRALVAMDERHAAGDDVDAARRAPAVESDEEIARAFPWIADPAMEPVRGSEESLRANAARALHTNAGPDAERLVQRAIADLAAMAQECAARGIAFGVAILPARHQIDASLFDAIRGDYTERERDAPAATLRDRLAARAIAHVDLTLPLRAAEPWTDGDPHLFHRGSTELNARGNQLVGEALAAFARRLLDPESNR